MTARIPPYDGEFPDQQEAAEDAARQLVEESQCNARFNSPQALAVLRVCIDEINFLRGRVEGLSHEIDDLSREIELLRANQPATPLAYGMIP